MKGDEPFFPYFLMMVGLLSAVVAAYSPPGPGQNVAIGIATGASSGSLTAWGMPYKYGKRGDPPS